MGLSSDLSRALPRTTGKLVGRIRETFRPYAPVKAYVESFITTLMGTIGSERLIEGITLALIDELETSPEAYLILETLEDVFDRMMTFRVSIIADRLLAMLVSRLARDKIGSFAVERSFLALGRILPTRFDYITPDHPVPMFLLAERLGGEPVMINRQIPEMMPILHKVVEEMEEQPIPAGIVFLGLLQGDLRQRIDRSPEDLQIIITHDLLPRLVKSEGFQRAMSVFREKSETAPAKPRRSSIILASRNLSPLIEASAATTEGEEPLVTAQEAAKIKTSQATVDSLPAILPMLHSASVEKRREACSLLADICEDDQVTPSIKAKAHGMLFQALSDPSEAVVAEAVLGLGTTDDEFVLGALCDLLEATPPTKPAIIESLANAFARAREHAPRAFASIAGRVRSRAVIAARQRWPAELVAMLQRAARR